MNYSVGDIVLIDVSGPYAVSKWRNLRFLSARSYCYPGRDERTYGTPAFAIGTLVISEWTSFR